MSETTATPEPTGAPANTRIDRRVVYASTIGTAVEYFDFSVYGYLATILAVLFFHSEDPTAALLATFATFAAAFVLRPVGGIVFGHLGDRIGRRKTLAATVTMMALASFMVGVLPTYAAIGTGATALLVLARCAQGIAAGGELPGAGSYLAETAPPDRRGLMCSFTQFGAYIGALLASLTISLLTAVLTTDQMMAWGWRIPFLAALPLGVVGIYIRTRLEDSPQFNRIKGKGEVPEAPLLEVLTQHKVPLLKTFGLSALTFATYYISYVYLTTHMQTQEGYSPGEAFWSTSIVLAVSCAVMPVFGLLADKIGRRPILVGASIGFLVLSYPLFLMLGSGGVLPYTAHVFMGVMTAALTAVAFTAFTELFISRIRYSGIALGLNLASMVVGGTAPYIAVALIDWTGDPLAPAYFLMTCAVITLAAAWSLKETKGSLLPEG